MNNKHDIKKQIINGQLKLVETLVEIIPSLKGKKNFIVDNIIKKKDKKHEDTDEIVLKQISHNNKQYYVDKCGCLVTEKNTLVGVARKSKVYLFDDIIEEDPANVIVCKYNKLKLS